MVRSSICFLLLFFFNTLFSQEILQPQNGLKNSEYGKYLLTNASYYNQLGELIEGVQILVHGNKIVSIGKKLIKPRDVIEIDCSEKYILPSFIELYTSIGITPLIYKSQGNKSQLNSTKEKSFYWNESIHPENNGAELYSVSETENKRFSEMGFGYAVSHQDDGIARGSGALVSLGFNEVSNQILVSNAFSFFSLSKGKSNQTYPSSQMGVIALVRQMFYDLNWYEKSKDITSNLSLEALMKQKNLPKLFRTDDKYETLRVMKISEEFSIPFVIFGSGQEYAYLDKLKSTEKGSTLKNQKLVLPLNYPQNYDVADPYVSRHISLRELKEWELAPFNAGLVKNAGIEFVFSTDKIKDAKTFWSNIRKTIKCGLSEAEMVKALSINVAKLLGQEKLLGSVEEGKYASFVIYDKNPLKEEAKIAENWLLGQRDVKIKNQNIDIRGKYNMLLGNIQYPLIVEGTVNEPKAKVRYFKQTRNEKTGEVKLDTVYSDVKLKLVENDISLQFFIYDENHKGSINLHAKVKDKFGLFEGDGTLANGEWVKWSAIKNEKFKEKVKPDSDAKKNELANDSLFQIPNSWFPNMAYGRDSLVENQTIVIRNATIWTNEEQAVINDGTLILKNGKIEFVGNKDFVTPNNAIVIDAKGKFVTSGIIDEHSHIAISKGVNESGQSISAEVNIGDVIDPDDINIYRQLAGGVTAAQLLHGSANPIGGQSALIKLKWGYDGENMLIKNAPKFIKFALGENVKQANWGDNNTIRFPQTRMGVEQVYYDAFDRALKYHEQKTKQKNDSEGNGEGNVKRRDLELDILYEILQGERFITCHSYVQSEINMFMHVADSLHFKINTFTHILEGYKVADKMAQHGVAGSTFSDWWAYKFEVNDAIPYNAKLMYNQGVLVAINSDDAEMARRLNQEAAKTMKYGGMPEMEAWKLVTLNPAKMLHLDDRMGSIKVGKDADIVIWSANPLSINAIVEYTIVDGQILYSLQSYQAALIRNRAEKARIIAKMLKDNDGGAEKQNFTKKKEKFFHCDTIGEEGTNEENTH